MALKGFISGSKAVANGCAWRRMFPRGHAVFGGARRARALVAQAVETPAADVEKPQQQQQQQQQQEQQQQQATNSTLEVLTPLSSLQAGTTMPDQAGLAEVTQQVLMSDPETADQFKRYRSALARVEAAKAAAAELEETFAQASRKMVAAEAQEEVNKKAKSKQVLAEAEVAAAEKLLAAAELEAAMATQLQQQLARQASQDADRVESIKAGAVAVAGGLLSALPLLLASSEAGLAAALSLATAAGSCFLFGATYRYVVRLDESDSHLRNGVVAAFGLVRAAAAGDVFQTSSAVGPLDLKTVVGPAALYTGESMILFAFAAAALEAAFRQGWVKRFGAPSQDS